MKIGGDYSRHIFTVRKYHGERKDGVAACVFVNSKSFVNGLCKSIDSKVDKAPGLEVDVLQIIGSIPRSLKFTNIGIFTGRIIVPGMCPHVLVATSAADMGVNHPNVKLVVNNKFTKDTSTLLQRRGRASRAGHPTTHVTDADVASHILLTRHLSNQRTVGQTSVETLLHCKPTHGAT